VEWVPKSNAYTYDVKMEFTYDEFRRSDTSSKVTKTLRWDMLTNIRVTPGIVAVNKIPRLAFFQLLNQGIAEDTALQRRVKYVSFYWYGGNQTLADYISVNQPSIGIVQKTAEYTNVNGGYGIFASRCIQAVTKVKMDGSSIFILKTNEETQNLNFIQ
jgi:hypothetical protein